MPTKPKKSHHMPIALIAAGMVILPILLCGMLIWCWVAEMNRRGGDPTNIAVAPDGTLYVNDPGRAAQLFQPISGSSVWVIDSQEDKVRGLIKLKNAGSGIAVAPNGKVYAFPAWADRSDVVEVVEKGAWRTTAVITTPAGVSEMSDMLFYEHKAFLLTGSAHQDGIQVIDTDTGQVVQSISFPRLVDSMVLLGNGKAYVAGLGHIWTFDAKTCTVTGEIPDIPEHEYGCAVLAPNGKVYVTYYHEKKRGVLALNVETGRAIGQIAVPSDFIVGMTIVPDGRIYLLHYGDEPEYKYYISVLDIKSDQVTKTIPLSPELYGPSSKLYHRMVTAPNGKVYVVHGFRASISHNRDDEMYVIVIDSTTDQVVGKIPLQLPWLDRLFPY